jgi:CubicO group peptidase (beta-lactamase class C family)
MKKQFAVLSAFLLLLTACAEDRPEIPIPHSCPPALDASLSAWAAAGFSGSIAISTNGALDCQAAYGSAGADTPNTVGTTFSIGSITKAFTAAAILRLAEDGRLSVDDRVGKVLPELEGPVRAATVRQLLLHTSGLNGTHASDSQPMSPEQALAAIGKLETVAPPGRRYLYSNAGYTLLALVVQKLSPAGYRDYLATKILRLPDGRTAGGFWNGHPAAPGPRARGYPDDPGPFAGPHWAVEGNGGLAMTTAELAAWTHALFTGRIVTARSAAVIATPGHAIEKGRAETPGWVAYDASLYGEPFLATAGGGGDLGHNAVVVWLPGRQRVIAIASNKPTITAENLLQAVGPALAAGKPLPPPKSSTTAAIPKAVAGTYRLDGGGSFDVTVRDGRVVVAATGADAVAALFPAPAGADPRAHEELVRKLLAGETREGRKERAAFESGFGPIDRVDFAGTIAYGGETRTYVSIVSRGKPVLGWFALNEAGGVEAAEVPAAEPPTLRFLPSGDNRYHVDDPGGVGPGVTLRFEKGRLTMSGPDGAVTSARPAGSR